MTAVRIVSGLTLLIVPSISADAGLSWRQRVERVAHYYATAYSLKYQIPPQWVHAIVRVESNWNPAATSPKGAMGIMQLMPDTAARYGVRNPYNLEQNIRGGIRHLAFLLNQFEGDLRLATAAYYAGEGPILKRRLDYHCPAVVEYVKRVADVYRGARPSQLNR
jgi:soluble lytic murein transglycosylase-like protein